MSFAACEIGKHGFNCETRCIFPYYGIDCQYKCKCATTDCHYADGCGQNSKIGILINLFIYLCRVYTIHTIFNLMFLNIIIAIKIFLHRENSNVFSDTLHQYVT